MNTNDGLELLAYARRGVEHAWRTGYGITKAGIILDDLMPAELRPRTLFEGDTEQRGRLMEALDAVNQRYGRFMAVSATQGFKREWGARSDSRSPSYITCLTDIPSVRAG